MEKNTKINDSYYKELTNKYDRRISRFINLLNSNNEKPLCFIRTEETKDNRIIYEEHAEKFIKSEYDYICDFSNIIKNKYPKLKFIILYFNYSKNLDFNQEYNIISFSKNKQNHDSMPGFVSFTKNIFKTHDIFINDCITKLYVKQ
jgi:hypothetical protein